jgi:hypothetical protein
MPADFSSDSRKAVSMSSVYTPVVTSQFHGS